MSVLYRRTIPLYLTFILALIVTTRSFINHPTVMYYATTILNWSSLIRAIAAGIGFVSLLLYHIPRIKSLSNKPVKYQWFYSLTAVVSAIVFAVTGIWFGTGSKTYLWLYNTWYQPTAGLITAVSAFFAVSAMYRSFRAKNIEALFLIIPALLILMYITPIGPILLPGMGPIADYIFNISSASFRGFIAAASIGTIIIAIRTILGMERGYLREEA